MGATVSGGVHYETPGEGPGHKDHSFPSYDFGLEMPYLQTGRTSGANASWPRGQPQPDSPHHVILTPHFPDVTYSVLWEQMTVFATMSAGAIGTTEADSTIATLAVPGHAPVSWDAEKDWGKALEKNDQPTPIARVDGITVPRSPVARFSFAWSAFNLGHPIISRIEAVRNLQSALQKEGKKYAESFGNTGDLADFVTAYVAELVALGLSAITDCDGLIFASYLKPISGTELYNLTSSPDGWFAVYDYAHLASPCRDNPGDYAHYNAAIRVIRTSG